MEDVTKCQKCSYPCVDPRILPCFHTFCFKCLEDIRSGRETGEPMPCPRCGAVTAIPAAGFRKNEFVKRLNRVATLLKPAGTEILCDACRNDEDEPKDVAATAFCLECRDVLCENCCRIHRKCRPCRNHRLIPFGTLPKSELETMLDLDFCDHHVMIPLEKYCEICKTVICTICLAESHQSHRCSDIKLAKDRLQRQILEEAGKLDVFSNSALVKQEEIEKKKTNFMEEIQYTETAVKKRGQELKDRIDRHTEALLEDVAKFQKKGLDQLNRQRIDLDLHSALVSSFKTYCSSLCDKGSSYDVCSPVNQIIDRVEQLKTQNDLHVQRFLSLPTTSLKKADVSSIIFEIPNVIGDIKVNYPPKIVHTANLEFTEFSVMGVAKLKNTVYILCRPPNETIRVEHRPPSFIRVYTDQEPFTFKSEIRLDLTSASDMAASQSDDHLYVTDLKQVYQMTGSSQRFSRFLPWEWRPHTISVSKEGRVMLAKDDKPCSLERHTAQAILVDRIQLPADVESVTHAVETSNGNVLVLFQLSADVANYVVSTSGRTDFSVLRQSGAQGIFEVTSAGNIVRWFSPRTQFYQLDYPHHLALDSNDQVFVADHGKDRMTQFDSELNMIQIIKTPGMFGPKRLFYDKAKQQLWIAHSKQIPTAEDFKDINGCVSICKVTPYSE